MKIFFTLVAVASMFTLVACGPSAEEKATQDSIAAVGSVVVAPAQVMVDSTNAFNAAKEAEAQRVADSTEAASKGKKK